MNLKDAIWAAVMTKGADGVAAGIV